MTRRLIWFVSGAVAALAGASATRRKVKSVAADLAPTAVAHRVADRVRTAVTEGRQAMHDKESELRRQRDERVQPQ